MAIDYTGLLSDEQKKNILEQRLTQFASEAFQHDINKQVAIASNNEEGIKQATNALATLEAALTIHQDELAKLSSAE
jgi:hypothetical protein